MIRFTCPGCETPFTVGDEKAGKAGKCPKCQSQFTIPAESNAPNDPPPPPPPPTSSTAVEIAPCPGCGSRLSVEAGDLGLDIECPNCQTQYKALRAGEAPPAPKKTSDTFKRPSRRDADDEEEDEVRPSQQSRRKRDEEEDEVRPSRRSSRRDDDDDDDDYRRQPKSKVKPGALTAVAVMLLVGGILSCLVSIGLIGYIGFFALISAVGTGGLGLVCCLWPGMYYQLVFGIMAIVRASQILGKRDVKGPPKGLCIMQIICIVNGDVTNCVMGIVGLVLLNNEDVRRWYARRGWRY